MSRLVSTECLAKLYRMRERFVATDILPRVMDELKPDDLGRFATDLFRRRPESVYEARALMNCFYRLPAEYRRSLAAMDLVFACESILSRHDVNLVRQ